MAKKLRFPDRPNQKNGQTLDSAMAKARPLETIYSNCSSILWHIWCLTQGIWWYLGVKRGKTQIIWVNNNNNSLPWIQAILGWFPLLTMNLPRIMPTVNRPNDAKERRPNDTSAIAGIEAPQRGLHREVTRGQGPGACAPFRREVTRGKPRKTTKIDWLGLIWVNQ